MKNAPGSRIIPVLLDSPLGPLAAAATDKGICLLEYADSPGLESRLRRWEKRYAGRTLAAGSPLIRRLGAELGEYFAGRRKQFSVPLDIEGTVFQKAAWEYLLGIPYGETRSYARQAADLGKPGAVRAAAAADGANLIAILVPCHRIIGSSGKLTGYSGGMERKEYLLKLERGCN